MCQKSKEKDRSVQCERGAGFSLLETLIALAILSLTSLILFQSTGTMMSVSEKAAISGERVIENTISRKVFNQLVNGLTPGWKDQEITMFRGNSRKFSGLSTNVPSNSENQLALFTLETRSGSETNSTDLMLFHEQRATHLYSFDGENAFFGYLGQDQKWYDIWPPESVPPTGFFDDVKYLKMPALPVAVRLSVSSPSEATETLKWAATVIGPTKPPYRPEINFVD